MVFIELQFGMHRARYSACFRHKFLKIQSIAKALSDLHYEVEITHVATVNAFVVLILGRLIYRCDIRQLKFNMPLEEDPLARHIIEVVREAARRFYDDDNVPKYTQIDGTRLYQPNKTCAVHFMSSGISMLCEPKYPIEYDKTPDVDIPSPQEPEEPPEDPNPENGSIVPLNDEDSASLERMNVKTPPGSTTSADVVVIDYDDYISDVLKAVNEKEDTNKTAEWTESQNKK